MILQLFSIFADSVVPVVLLILLGYIAGPKLHLEVTTLSRTAYYLLIPALVFHTISQADIPVAIAARMIGYIFVVHIACAFVGFLIAILLKRPPKIIAAYVLIAVFGNVANIGLPVIEFHFGQAALVEGTLYFVAIFMIAMLVGIMAASWASHGGKKALVTTLKTPGIVALVPATFFWITNYEVPLFLSRTIGLLGQAMIPIMLVTFGLQLAKAGRPRLTSDVVFASAVRLLGAPVLAILLAIPFGLTGLERETGILQASMPPAVSIMIIALEHKLDAQFMTATLLFSTFASMVTLTVLLSWL